MARIELSPVSRRVEEMDGKDVPIQTKSNGKPLRDKSYQTQQKDERARECVYCEKPDHRSVDCKTVTTLDERKRLLSNTVLIVPEANTGP